MNQSDDQQYKRLFKATPAKILVLRPGNFEIIAVTDEYLKATMTREGDIVGKTLFEVFPDDPEDEQADGVTSLSASLARVQSLKIPDVMGIQRYPVRLPSGVFEERFWSPVNSPVLDEAGDIEFIMHRVEDITAIIKEGASSSLPEAVERYDPIAVQDIFLWSKELRQNLSKLQEYEARMRTAERLLNLGAWEFNLTTEQLSWSRQVFEIYNMSANRPPPDLDGYFDLVHPDDRASSRATYDAFEKDKASRLEFKHRVTGENGEVKHVKGMGERHLSSDGEIIVGYVQDITPFVRTRHQLTQAEQLLALAGEKARLGGWRVELDSESVVWTQETAAIHGMPADYSPSGVDEAIDFYVPECRESIQAAFEQCARKGEAFDRVCQLQKPDGQRPWVRTIGEAERDDHGKIIAAQGAFQDISTLHEAQVRADEAEHRRLNILESISDAFFTLDEQWNFTFANRQTGLLLERSCDELIGRNVWQEFPETVGSQFEREYRLAVESRETRHFQASFPPLDKWFAVTAYPVDKGLTIFFRDVTRDRRHQEQLRLVHAALSRQNDTVIITEADSVDMPDGPRIVFVNDAFERLTGYSRDEAIGLTPRILQGPETDRQALARIRTALESHDPVRTELLNYHKSGQGYWLEIDITPLFDEAEHCTHYVAVQRDITERKEQETALLRAQQRFQLISRATNDVIRDYEVGSGEVWWNDAFFDVFGYSRSELEPGLESWTERIHPDDLDRVHEGLRKALDGIGELWSAEYRFIKKNSQVAHVIDRGFIIRDRDGNASRMVGSMLDISERMAMEQQLREAQKLEAVGHLTGGVAHDFNNLLTVILGNAETLAELLNDAKLRSMAELTVSAARRGAELTSRLLAFARRQPLAPELIDINQLIENMQPLMRRTLPENIELEIVPALDLGVAEIDASELDTALLNLIVNARDAMPDGGKLTIETANASLDANSADRHADIVPGQYLTIVVSDTGEGMDSKTARRAFEPFFTTKNVGKGSGLGLSMVFGFTKQSGGHIRIDSKPGEGTAVKMYFPRAIGTEAPRAQGRADTSVQVGTEHILIAEDDELVRQYLARQLRSLGYRVTAVASGPEALAVLETSASIELLLTDIIMPGGMNGRELARFARALHPALKVLFTSGYTEDAIVHHGRLDPGVDLLSKPYTRIKLARKLRDVLDEPV